MKRFDKPLMVPAEILQFARELRIQQTDPERLLWMLLRNRQFMGLKFRRQHPLPPFILDFYCRELLLAIELDGGQHNSEEARRYDERRSILLTQQGIHVVRFWNHDVLESLDYVVEAIVLQVEKRKSPRT